MVTKAMSVRSRSGRRGLRAASAAARSTCAGNSGVAPGAGRRSRPLRGELGGGPQLRRERGDAVAQGLRGEAVVLGPDPRRSVARQAPPLGPPRVAAQPTRLPSLSRVLILLP